MVKTRRWNNLKNRQPLKSSKIKQKNQKMISNKMKQTMTTFLTVLRK